MAEGQVKQMLEKEITCPLCLDLFKDPKKLPCDHVYCKDCLRGLALRSLHAAISCPECRTLTQVPGNDVNNFPTAFQTNRLIEAFQQVQIRVETDSPSATDMCQVHPTQPLAIYCETCKKQLCRDCVLMSKEHSSHEYGFFKEVAPKYRKRVASELSLIKTQTSSVSNVLEEIAATETSIENHAQKCQDDVEQAFEELISVLQTCKQAMKDEATAYYSSLTGVFDQQKERLKDIQSTVESVIPSADTTTADSDQSFLVKLESTFEKISNLQKKFQSVSLTVAKPQLIAMQSDHDTDALSQYLKKSFFFTAHNLADAKMCSIDSSFTDANLCVGQQILFTLTFHDSSRHTYIGENEVDVNLLRIKDNHSIKGKLEQPSRGHIETRTTPTECESKWSSHQEYSPFTVNVYMPPNLLSQPVATISRLKRPASLVYSHAENKVLAATEINSGVIVKLDAQFRLMQSEFVTLIHVTEITEDQDSNIYATTEDNQLHKLSIDGRIIKTVGQMGTRNAEFHFPNGLRVSKKRELYVCDSSNSCVQVFDLDLNFKRSFGKQGTGKGEFDFPSDVEFDFNGRIYIADNRNQCIQVFNSTAEQLIRIIKLQEFGFEPLSLCMHFDQIYVTDSSSDGCIFVIATSGEVIATFGKGILNSPEGITIDKNGFVYVTSHYSRIVVF